MSRRTRPTKRIMPCSEMVAPEIKAWLARLRRQVVETASVCSRGGPHSARVLGLRRLMVAGLRSLERNEAVALPTDKHGGYCRMQRSLLHAIHHDVLENSGWYSDTRLELMTFDGVHKRCAQLCHCIDKLEADERLLGTLMTSVWGNSRMLQARLILTVKTHKG